MSFKVSGEALDIRCLYKGIRIPPSSLTPSLCLHLLSAQATMSGSGGQGKWMVSSVKEEDITELRAAGYLAKEIAHRLPAEGQVVPTPKPTERVVFLPHFFRV